MKISMPGSVLLCVVLLVFGVSIAYAAPMHQTTTEPAATDPAEDWERVQKAGKLVIGTAADYAPFEFYNSNYEFDGFDIALAKALGEQLGVAVEFNDFAFDGLLNQVKLGNIDAAIGAISVTSERRKQVDFTNLYYVGSSAVVAASTFTQTITSASDMAGLSVGVQNGTTYQAWAQKNLVETGYIPQESLIPYSSMRDLFNDIRSNKLDVGLMGQLTAESAVRSRSFTLAGEGLSAQKYAIAVRKDSSLAQPINEALLTLQLEGKLSELSKLYLAETPVPASPDAGGAVVSEQPTVTPDPPQATATPGPTPTPDCIYSMKWIADLNLDDQNMTRPPILLPGQLFTKGWRVKNDGTCAWAADFALVYASGNRIESAMGGTLVQVGKEVQVGEEFDLNIELRAPQTYGVFQGFWRMHDSLRQSFGEVIWVGIQVPNPNPPTPTPVPVAPTPLPPPAQINPNLRADSLYIAPGQCTALRWDIDNIRAIFLIDGNSQQGVGGHDARTVCPGATTTYTLRVVSNGGETFDFSITINVSGNASYSINFWVDRESIDAGQCTTLRWDVRNVRAVYLNNEGVGGVSQRDVCPRSTQTYNLSVTKNDGSQDGRRVTIRVNNGQPPTTTVNIRRFDVNRNVIRVGECVTLEWDSDNSRGANLQRNGTTILDASLSNGSYQDCQGTVGVNQYKLTVYNQYNQQSRSLSVVVQESSN